MNIKRKILKAIEELVGAGSYTVEFPGDESVGDLASNVALAMSKTLGRSPKDLAGELGEKLMVSKEFSEVVERIEVAGPGFLNFRLRDDFLIKELLRMEKDKDLALNSDFMTGKKVLVEYSSPNIAKRFSVGHLRSTIIGQAIFNLYKRSGAEVTNDNHLGDWGTQFGMIIAAVEEKNLEVSKMDIPALESLYIEFNKRIEERPELKDKAREAFARLEGGDARARKIWQECVAVSMKEFDEIYEKLGVKFVHELGESAYEEMMPKIIDEALRLGVAEEGERGALVVKFEKDGKEYMPVAMLRKSDGTTTYFTRDLATIRKRLDDPELRSDLYVYEIGGEQTLHMRQVFEAARMLWDEAGEVMFKHVAHGMMSLPEGKMSTRKGRTVKLEDLMLRAGDEARVMAKERIPESEVEKIGIGSVKYNELKRSPESSYVFRWEEALAMEGNSGPYLQYVYVRTKGVLAKAEETGQFKALEVESLNDDERKLVTWLVLRIGSGEMVENAAKGYAPHLVCQTIFELSQRFNGFYDRNRVIGAKEERLRLLMVSVVNAVIKSSLSILGIEVPERM